MAAGEAQAARRERRVEALASRVRRTSEGGGGSNSGGPSSPATSRAAILEAPGSAIGTVSAAMAAVEEEAGRLRSFFRWRSRPPSPSGTPRQPATAPAASLPAQWRRSFSMPADAIPSAAAAGGSPTGGAAFAADEAATPLAAAGGSASAARTGPQPASQSSLPLPQQQRSSLQSQGSSLTSPFEAAIAAPGGPSSGSGGSGSGSGGHSPWSTPPAAGTPSASPPQPPPLQLSPARARRLVSLPPDLPTVVSQQVLHVHEAPSLPPLSLNLPPLHIPAHRQPSPGGKGPAAPPWLASAGASDDDATPVAQLVPRPVAFGSSLALDLQPAEAAAAAPGAPELEAQPTRSSQQEEPGSAASGAATARGVHPLRRPSTSSTAFWQGTPKAPAARRDRTRWLHERALGRSFMAGKGRVRTSERQKGSAKSPLLCVTS